MKRIILNIFLSRADRNAFSLGKVLLDPENYLRCRDGEFWLNTKHQNAPFGEKVSDIYVRCEGITLAYIQNIEIRKSEGLAIIGHFAVDPKFVSTGLARCLIKSFAKSLSDHCSVQHILFDETNIKDRHKHFFEKTLGAVETSSVLSPGVRMAWKWDVN